MRFRSLTHRLTAMNAGRSAGVTLVELIMVIVISGIVATMLTAFIIRPIEGYEAQVRRAELVDAAEMALRRMARDIRAALPNSVRIAGGNQVIEMLNTIDGARYREGPGTNPGGHNHAGLQYRLRFTGADNDGFNLIGFDLNIAPIPFNSTTERLSVYNQGVPGADAYADANAGAGTPVVITNPAVTTFQIANDDGGPPDERQITPLTGNFQFRWRSPAQRIFIVDVPVTYICSPGVGGTVTRYSNYAITAAQPTDPTVLPLSVVEDALLSTPVTACSFTYNPGTPERAGLVTLDITVGDLASGDRVRLLHQVHVDNSP